MNHNTISLIKIILLLFISSNIFLFATSIQNNSNLLLENRSFEGQTGIKGEKSDHIDVLKFKNGKFKSKRCKEWGFTAGKFNTTIEKDKILFDVYTKSSENGTLHWTGVVEDNKLKAKYVWTKKILFWEIKNEYWFEGIEIIQDNK